MKRIGVIVLAIMSIFNLAKGQESKEAAFWKWFRANDSRLFNFEKDQERIFDEVNNELERVRPGLMFEFGPIENGSREFVISADGIRAAIPAVIALADRAPTLARWKVTKFRPRRDFTTEFMFDGIQVKSEQIKFTIEPDGEKAGIKLFIYGYNADRRNTYVGIGFLFLDHYLGEYDVMTKVGFIEFKGGSEPSRFTKRPLSELPSAFDKFINSKLN